MHVPSLLVLISLLTTGPVTAQRTYLGVAMEPVAKSKAVYYKEPDGMLGTAYKARIWTMEGKLKAEGCYQDAELKVAHGIFSFFHPNGKVESTGNYDNGVKSGVWHRYDTWGMELAEKVYDAKPVQDIVYTLAPTMPEYPGGEKELVRYIKSKAGEGQLAKGEATASFVVEKDGRLSGVKVIATTEEEQGLIEQALMESGNWQVGEKDGVPVRVVMQVPIKY